MSAPGRTEHGRELSPLGITPNQALGRADHSYGYLRRYLAKTTKREHETENAPPPPP
jgi:hypothetical protein